MRKLVIIALLAITLISCDNRDPEVPSITVTIANETLYTNQNFNTTNVYIKLSGEYESLYANQIIDVSYNADLASILTNSGDAAFFVTDNSGIANGNLYTRSSGSLNIAFSVRGYDNVNSTKHITIYHPYIYTMQASSTVAIANGENASVITVRIRPLINNQAITFTTTLGTLFSDTTTTNSNGESINAISSTEVGQAEITAILQVEDLPPAITTIYITFIEP